MSTCTRAGVRRPAVEKLASPQQASLKLHEETWAGLLQNQGLGIFQEVEIVPGWAVRVANCLYLCWEFFRVFFCGSHIC